MNYKMNNGGTIACVMIFFFLILYGGTRWYDHRTYNQSKRLIRKTPDVSMYRPITMHLSNLDVENEKRMVNLLLPKVFTISNLKRVGSLGDGGYIVPKIRNTIIIYVWALETMLTLKMI